MEARVLLEAVLSPFLYNSYTSDIPRAAGWMSLWYCTQMIPRYWPNSGKLDCLHEDFKAKGRLKDDGKIILKMKNSDERRQDPCTGSCPV